MSEQSKERILIEQEIKAKSMNGMVVLILDIGLMLLSVAGIIFSLIRITEPFSYFSGVYILTLVVSSLYLFVIGPILFGGLKILKPNEAFVLTLFGKYYGTLKGEGFFFVNPFVSATNPAVPDPAPLGTQAEQATQVHKSKQTVTMPARTKKIISLKTMTLSNDRQKINDKLGNPIIIGIVVIWKVVNTAKAVFNVDHYVEYLSIQCDSALRNIVRLYPYDAPGDDNEKSLRGSSQEVADRLKEEIQEKVDIAGLEIMEARITHLAYAPEIASAMLQRQQASAIIDARQMIVEGAVGMVDMALKMLSENEIVELDEERKATMVSNLLVVLCSNKDPQPVVNSGSIY